MIVARSLLRSSIKPMCSVMRMINTKPLTDLKDAILSKVNIPFLSKRGESPASVLDVIDTFKAVNYRYEFPQNLTEEQKKHMKRFDIFRHAVVLLTRVP